MIVVVCPGCGSKLNAKEELAGQTRKCPKCAASIQIVLPEPGQPMPTGKQIEQTPEVPAPADVAPTLLFQHLIARLDRQHYYLVCDRSRVLAMWEGNGRGWMLKTNTGPVSASRGDAELPVQGDFRLVEVVLGHEETGMRLHGIRVFRLVQHWALVALTKGDDQILRKLAGPGGLGCEQKVAVRNAIKERYMQDVWASAQSVMDYLANNDFHSPGSLPSPGVGPSPGDTPSPGT